MPPSYIRVRAVVWAYGRGQTDTQTQTDRQTHTRVTKIHFASSTTHAKCNDCLHLHLFTFTSKIVIVSQYAVSMDPGDHRLISYRQPGCGQGHVTP